MIFYLLEKSMQLGKEDVMEKQFNEILKSSLNISFEQFKEQYLKEFDIDLHENFIKQYNLNENVVKVYYDEIPCQEIYYDTPKLCKYCNKPITEGETEYETYIENVIVVSEDNFIIHVIDAYHEKCEFTRDTISEKLTKILEDISNEEVDEIICVKINDKFI